MKSGTKHSAHALFERYGDVVYRRCFQMLRDEDAAFDALQDVFVRVIRDRRFREDCSPMTWLYRIATTYCLQQLRNQRRGQEKLAKLAEMSGQNVSTPDPEGALTVDQILKEQDEMTRQIAYCRFVDGMTLEETADVVGVSRKTVARHMRLMSEYAERSSASLKERRHA